MSLEEKLSRQLEIALKGIETRDDFTKHTDGSLMPYERLFFVFIKAMQKNRVDDEKVEMFCERYTNLMEGIIQRYYDGTYIKPRRED